ncbi:MAG: hypothetical protein ABI759_09230 [Candidatus Solibacter sp.]
MDAASRLLRERYPVAPYLHMTDLISGSDPFQRRNGWTDVKIDVLISDIESLLARIDKKNIYSAVFTINRADCDQARAEKHSVPDPAVVCAQFCLYHPPMRYWEAHSEVEFASLFYDQGEKFIQSIRASWLESAAPGKLAKNSFWGRIAKVEPVDMRFTPPVQIADMLAWAATRRIREEPNDKWARLANSLIGTRQHSGILPCSQVDPITLDEIRRRYPKP